ncbi:MAG: RpiB/LacA/LacB family sugar-phosphate isomerase [Eubacteriales bacterium]|nr:RpiB/LacA/LacB family sugar-phosphate isomerase [Eubacteriales bacterium]
MTIAIGSDHAGYPLKAKLLEELKKKYDVLDFGCHSEEPVDFPDIAKLVCAAVLDGRAQRGVMFCGTGVGAAIACNKIPGIRACVCHDVYTAHQCVEHDDVQVIALGNQIIGYTAAAELIDLFLKAEFSGGEAFRRRVEKLAALERRL